MGSSYGKLTIFRGPMSLGGPSIPHHKGLLQWAQCSPRRQGMAWEFGKTRIPRGEFQDRHQYKALPLMMGVDGFMCYIYRMNIWLYRLRSCFFLKHFVDSFLSLSHVSLEENKHISKSWKHYSYITRTYMNVYNIDTKTHADTLNSFSISVHIHFNNFSTFFPQWTHGSMQPHSSIERHRMRLLILAP